MIYVIGIFIFIYFMHHGMIWNRVCRKTLFSSDQCETPGELFLGMDY